MSPLSQASARPAILRGLTAFPFCRCLVHIFKENSVRYSKIRPLNPQCQLDLCRHEVRYGCGREDECFYAHSLIELKVWLLQHERGETANLKYQFRLPLQVVTKRVSCIPSGTTHESIVQDAKKFWNATMSVQGNQVSWLPSSSWETLIL